MPVLTLKLDGVPCECFSYVECVHCRKEIELLRKTNGDLRQVVAKSGNENGDLAKGNKLLQDQLAEANAVSESP